MFLIAMIIMMIKGTVSDRQFQTSLFVSPELSSVRDYVITHSVCSM